MGASARVNRLRDGAVGVPLLPIDSGAPVLGLHEERLLRDARAVRAADARMLIHVNEPDNDVKIH